MNDIKERDVLWFGCGFALAGILSFIYSAPNYIPAVVAFGLLCFGCGVVLMLSLYLRMRSEEELKSRVDWMNEVSKLHVEKSKLEEEREEWEAEKAEWEANKELSIQQAATRILQEEAVRRDDGPE